VVTDSGGTADGFSSVFDTNLNNTQSVRYLADTEGGSSGSPVIDYNSNLVIAIHNTGGCPNGSYGRSDELISELQQFLKNVLQLLILFHIAKVLSLEMVGHKLLVTMETG